MRLSTIYLKTTFVMIANDGFQLQLKLSIQIRTKTLLRHKRKKEGRKRKAAQRGAGGAQQQLEGLIRRAEL